MFIDGRATIHEAAKIMAKKGIGSVIVGSPKSARGVFSERDLLMRIAAKGVDCRKARLEDYMTKHMERVHIDASTDEALKIMSEKHIRRLPVTDGKHIVGIISIRRIAESMKYEYMKKASAGPNEERAQYSGYW